MRKRRYERFDGTFKMRCRLRLRLIAGVFQIVIPSLRNGAADYLDVGNDGRYDSRWNIRKYCQKLRVGARNSKIKSRCRKVQ